MALQRDRVSLTESQHQQRESEQNHQTHRHHFRLADDLQRTEHEVTSAVRFQIRVLQLKHHRSVRYHAQVSILDGALRYLDAAVEQSSRFVARELEIQLIGNY